MLNHDMKTFTKHILGTFFSLGLFFQLPAQEVCETISTLPPHTYDGKTTTRSLEDIIEIPVVFHLVGDETIIEDITDEQLSILTGRVNQILAGTNREILNIRSEFEHLVGQANIELYIEEILRVPSDVVFKRDFLGSANNLELAKFSVTGGSDPWNTERYLNIWIIDIFKSNGNDNNFTLGYGTPPRDLPGWPETDFIQGILLNEVSLDRPRVLAHELGHYLGLRHIAEIATGNCQDYDGIEDTPRSSTAVGCSYADSCPNGLPDMVENLMNATLENCRSVFTKGQVEFMRNTIEDYRPELFRKFEYWRPGPLPEFTMFPTMAHFQLRFAFEESDVKIVNYKIYTRDGIMVESGKFLGNSRGQLLLPADLTAGLYFIQLEFQNGTVMKKFIRSKTM